MAQQQHIVSGALQGPQQALGPGGGAPVQQRLQLPVLRAAGDKLQILCAQNRLILGLPQIQAVAIDEFLGHRIDQMGDVPVGVHRLPDAGGADLLQFLRQRQLQHMAAYAPIIRRHSPRPAEDHMVKAVDGVCLRGLLIGGGMGHHIAAHHNGYLPPREGLSQTAQVLGVGDIHRKVLRENMHIEFIRHRHGGNLPPDAVGLGALRPGEFVNGQQHLKPLVPDGPDDSLVGQGKGIEGPREEGQGPGGLKGYLPAQQLLLHQEAVELAQHGRPVVEGQSVFVRRLAQGQNPPHGKLQGPAFLPSSQSRGAEHPPSQQIHGLLAGAGVDARSALHQHSQQPPGPAPVHALALRETIPVGGIVL